MKPEKRFFIDRHEDGEWYLIPQANREEWEEFRTQDWRNELSDFTVPEWATWLEFGVSSLTFTDPMEE